MHHQLRIAILLLACALAVPAAAQVKIDSNTFGGLEARSLGPAVMSGRIAAIDAVPADPPILYVGSASGGLWKSDDGGTTFEPVFDDHSMSIGAVRVDPSDPDTVWVGTGETWVRNSVSVGDGVYKTTDGGESWSRMGLETSERIARIQVHPEDSDTVWVCATGRLWSAGGERGVYKTTDAGESWERVLHVDDDTGCGDLALDPQEPDILYASMWQFRRYPDFFESGGPGSGLYKTTDGGTTWRELREGLPEGDLGRIGIGVAPSRPSVVYAVVEAEDNALYRSEDLGESWTEVNSSFNIGARPFYFAQVVVDPADHDYVYKPGFFLAISTDGGRSFGSILGGGFGTSVHSDHHALWIDPRIPQRVVLGTDGGLYISEDRAHSFRFVGALPVSQFYRVGADDRFPYNVYGGLQDNGTWQGPSRSSGGVRNADWRFLYGGDGFWALPDLSDPDLVFVEYQGGELRRVVLSTLEAKDVKPYPGEGEPDLRFNWNTPIHLSRSRPGTIYIGAQYLFRSPDRGDSWQRISPDLTTNDPQRQRQEKSGGLTIDNSTAENNATIYAISESPLDARTIWVGTDDGRVQVTRDGGESWTDVTPNIPGVPEGTWVSSVEASRHDAGVAYVTFDGHRSGDMATYAYRTSDHGATWASLVTDEIEGYAFALREDLVNPELLFLGTEYGLYLTLDGGRLWARFTGNLPKVAVHDMLVHPREGDLILATHGRGIYILDDLTPLRALTNETLESEVALLPSRPAVQMIPGGGAWFSGDAEFVGRNPPESAAITYYLKKRHLFGDLKVEVYDGEGELITTLPASKRRGINRVGWPMRLPAPKVPPANSLVPAFTGPLVPEGTYTIKLIKGDTTLTGEVELVGDPRSPHSAEDRALQQQTALALYRELERMTYLIETLVETRDALRGRVAELAEGNRLRRDAEEAADELEALRAGIVATSEAGMLSGEQKLREKLAGLYGSVNSYMGRPTESQLDRREVLVGELDAAFGRFETFETERLAALNRALERRGLEAVTVPTREEWQARQE